MNPSTWPIAILAFSGLAMPLAIPFLAQPTSASGQTEKTGEWPLDWGQPSEPVQAYIADLKKMGWKVDFQKKSMGNVVIELEREYKGNEKHGALGVPWQNRDSWKFTYVPQGDSLKLLDADGVRAKKAPLFGEWERAQRLNELPPDVQKTIPLLTTDPITGIRSDPVSAPTKRINSNIKP